MKKLLFALIIFSLCSCHLALEVRRSYTCEFMLRHPLKDTTGSIQESYKKQYKAYLHQEEIDSCLHKK